MKLRNFFGSTPKARAVQTGRGKGHVFTGWMDYIPLTTPDNKLYDSMREAVPIIDAAIDKIVRLTGGFAVESSNPNHQKLLDDYVSNIPVGPTSRSLRQFITTYLDSLLTYGNAVGEIVLDSKGRNIKGLYNASLSDIHLKPGKSPLETIICTQKSLGKIVPVSHPQLILFTPLNPPAGKIRGESLLKSLPFVSKVLMQIYETTHNNFKRVGNLRYAVTYNPDGSNVDRIHAKEIATSMAEQWAEVMSSNDSGHIKDFVAVGDVEIRVIGADNQVLETEVPVRQLLEQIVAKLGIPPFMLGLHWSTTERMSAQQADILTSELTSYRHLLEGVILKICETFLRLEGLTSEVKVVWDNINLQDQLEEANVRLLNAQAHAIGKSEEKGRENEKHN